MHCADRNKLHQLLSVSKLKVKKIKISYQIGSSGFRFRETVLMRTNFKFQIVQNMVMNNNNNNNNNNKMAIKVVITGLPQAGDHKRNDCEGDPFQHLSAKSADSREQPAEKRITATYIVSFSDA
jgi:hypothetical protein